jgi:hypothetical protein
VNTHKPMLEFLPGVGIGPILFGMNAAQVVQVLEPIGLTGDGAFFGADNSVQVEYTNEAVTFIGLAHSALFEARVFGVDPFDTPAEDLFALIASHEPNPHAFDRTEYVFPDSIITLWEADEQYNPKGLGRPVWGQVGLGNDVYWKQIQALR